MAKNGLSYCNLQKKVCVDYQNFCQKGGNFLQLLSKAMLEVYRVVFFTVISAVGQQHKSANMYA